MGNARPSRPTRLPDVVIDHHVHLQLIDTGRLPGGLSGVVDLGSGPSLDSTAPDLPIRVARAGCFLTAPGGYPSDRSWAPPGSVREVIDPDDARLAVAEQRARGAALIKVTLHREAGPVCDVATLQAIVAAADELPVVAHAEGPGMVERALRGGCDALAHTPWTERVPDPVIAEAARHQRWISTLTIHEGTAALAIALDNLGRFHAAGGQVLYGTDLGNGDLPVGVNLREVDLLGAAGLDDAAVAAACGHPWPHAEIE